MVGSDTRGVVLLVTAMVVGSMVPVATATASPSLSPPPDAANLGGTDIARAPAGQNVSEVRVVVTFESHASKRGRPITAQNGTITGGRDVDLLPVLFARVNENALDAIRRAPGVTHVSRDVHVKTVAQTTAWGLTRIGGRDAATTVERGVDIGVIDTGVASRHEDLNGSVAWGANTVGDDSVSEGRQATLDGNGHGTLVAGIAAAEDNDIGVVGVTPTSDLYALKALSDDGTGRVSDIIEAVDTAVKGPDDTIGTADDADVISMSFGASDGTTALRDALQEASDRSVLVAAAGNRGDGDPDTNDVLYPAKYPSVVAVAATNQADETTTWSSEGDEVEVAAPGVEITSTVPGDGYAAASGTSMAAPYVSGTAALVIAADLADGRRDLSPTEVRRRLHRTTMDIEADGIDPRSGYGLVQADAAVTSVNPPEIAIRQPRAGTTVSGSVTIGVNATDAEDAPTALDVDVAIDDGTWQNATYDETSGTYHLAWNTTTVTEGNHTITARVIDSGGNVVTDAVTVQVDNTESGPTVRFVTPDDGATVAGNVLTRVAATDDRTSTTTLSVAYRIDDGQWRDLTYDPESGYFEATWNASALSTGDHVLEARAVDGANMTGRAHISIDVANRTNVSVGTRLGAVAPLVHARLEGAIETRAFGIRIARAATANARAEIVAERLAHVEARLAELNRSVPPSNAPTGAVRREAIARGVELATLRRMAQLSATAADTIPADMRERAGIGPRRARSLARQAHRMNAAPPRMVGLTDGATADALLADGGPPTRLPPVAGDRGPPGDAPRGGDRRHGRPEDAGAEPRPPDDARTGDAGPPNGAGNRSAGGGPPSGAGTDGKDGRPNGPDGGKGGPPDGAGTGAETTDGSNGGGSGSADNAGGGAGGSDGSGGRGRP